jgi:hypothetical protein
MRKIITFITAIFILANIAKSQSISPDISNEFCPEVIYAFAVSIPGTNPVLSATNGAIKIQDIYGSSTTGGTTTFNFTGKFQDNNSKQVFKVDYKDANNNNKTTLFEFKKIKSLFFKNPSIAQQ